MRVRLMAVLLSGMVALGACGSSKSTTTAAAGSTVAGNATATSTTSGGESSGSAGGVGGAGALTSAKCAETATAFAKAASALPQAYSGTSADLKKSVDELQAFVDAAPSEIRPDVKTMVEGYAQVMAILVAANYDPSSRKPPSPETIQKLTEAGQKLDTSDFKAASERVTTWFNQKCGR